MGEVYQAHKIDLLSWADRLAGAEAKGTAQGIELASSLQKLVQSRKMFPIEMQKAKIEADLLQSELKRAKVFNSSEMLELAAQGQIAQMELGKRQAQKDLQGMKVLASFNDQYGAQMEKAMAIGDYQAVAKIKQDQAATFGEFAPYLSKSPYWGANVEKRMDERGKADMERYQNQLNFEAQLKIKSLNEERKVIDDRKALLQHDWAEAMEPAQLLGGIFPQDVGAGGDKNSDPDALRDGIMNYSAMMVDQLSSVDADRFDDEIRFFAELGNIADNTFKKNIFGSLKAVPSRALSIKRQSTKDAIDAARTIMFLARGIDTKDEKQHAIYTEQLVNLLQGFTDVTSSATQQRALADEYEALQFRREGVERGLQVFSGAPSETRRSVITHERGAGYGTPAATAAAAPTGRKQYTPEEAAALPAGTEYYGTDGNKYVR